MICTISELVVGYLFKMVDVVGFRLVMTCSDPVDGFSFVSEVPVQLCCLRTSMNSLVVDFLRCHGAGWKAFCLRTRVVVEHEFLTARKTTV